MTTSEPGRAALLIGALLLGCTTVAAQTAETDGWLRASPGYEWSFPRDHWAHRDHRTEWWYFTGHLESAEDPARRLGYQFTLFRVGLGRGDRDPRSAWSATNMLMGHASLTDKATGRHRFSELLYRESPLLAGFAAFPEQPVAWSRAPAGTDGTWELRWNGEAFDFSMVDDVRGMAFDLSTRPSKPLVFQGPGGYSRKGESTATGTPASLYYSFTRLATEGRVRIDGEWWDVSGTSWMDKEFSTSTLAVDQVGWDWFSLQLRDGRDLMLYVLRDADGGVSFGRGTLVSPSGEATYLEPRDWRVTATGRWRSDVSDAVYPSGWTLAVPDHGIDVVVQPVVAAQENVSRLVDYVVYWEGAVTVRDSAGVDAGRGYVELTGYGEGTRPPL